MNPKIFFLGDVHGKLDHVFKAVKQHRPDAIIFLGDIEAEEPFHHLLAPLLDKIIVRFIHGNHDTDRQRYFENLFGKDSADLNLHGRVENICGVRIAGLGGVFRESVWHPQYKKTFNSYDEYVKALRSSRPYRERSENSVIQSEQERKHRSTIFPDVINKLAMQDADVLVTHEAPSCHPHGFHKIDELARYLGVDKAFHGHHHDRIDYENQWRWICFEAYGVGFRGITDLNGSVILPGQND